MLLTVRQVAERLHCSEGFVYGLLASGRLRHHVLGAGQGGKRVSDDQLTDYLRSTERGGGLDSPKPAPTGRRHDRSCSNATGFLFLPPRKP
jgi:excisionase family DNA binding protein